MSALHKLLAAWGALLLVVFFCGMCLGIGKYKELADTIFLWFFLTCMATAAVAVLVFLIIYIMEVINNAKSKRKIETVERCENRLP